MDQNKQFRLTMKSNKYFVEILSLVASAGTLIAMVVILSHFDQHPQPDWQRGSLSSMVSWLSAISKGCVLFAVNEAVGQLVFPDFESVRSRWMRILHRRLTIFCSLAALLVLALEQNLIHYVPKMVEDSSQQALLANGSVYKPFGGKVGFYFFADQFLKSNVYNSIFNTDPQKPWSVPRYWCSTGNCVWDPVAALEMRSLCSDVTEYLNTTCSRAHNKYYDIEINNCTVALSNETAVWFLEGASNRYPMSMSTLDEGSSIKIYKNATFPPIQSIVPVGQGSFSYLNSTKWHATECSLEPIVRSFRPVVQDGILTEETLDIWTQIEDIEEYGYLALLPTWGSDKGVHRDPFFAIGPFSTLAMYPFLSSLFTGHGSMEHLETKIVPTSRFSDIYASFDALYALTNGEIASCSTEVVDKLSCSMSNVAAAMSKTFRDAPCVAPDFYWSNATMAEGRAFSKKMYAVVHWQWIVFSFSFWMIGMVAYIGMWKSRQDKVALGDDVFPLLESGDEDN